jgi:hypothetical protein
MSSGHVFICFDSTQTRNRCVEAFNLNTKGAWEACWSIFKEKMSKGPELLLQRRRMTSTFQKFNDEEALDKLRNQTMKIIMTPITHYRDIFWANMGGTRGFFFFRRVVINLVAILILIFLTTPASLVRSIQKLDFLDLDTIISEDSSFGALLHEVIPPLIIISINQLFLVLIDYAAFMEKHQSFSQCQFSIYQRSVLYLGFNMLIIPALTLVSADPLYEIILSKADSIAEALKNFYFSPTGSFFIIVLLQNACFSSAYHILRGGEIMNAFGSTFLAHYKRQYMNDSERWRKTESDVFQYGFFYAQMVIAYAICITFS